MKVICDISVTSGRNRSRQGWHPGYLFRGGAQGAWFDPSDMSMMFQDVAGTTPVAADGDPVGLMMDKSGNGNHATQSVSAARPIYRTDGTLHWLEHDGVDDRLKIPAIPYSSSMTVCIGLNRFSGGTYSSFRSSYAPPYVYAGLSRNGEISTLTNSIGGTDRIDGAIFSGTRADLYNTLQQPRVGTGFHNTSSELSVESTFLAFATMVAPGRVFAYVEVENLSIDDLPKLESSVGTKTGVVI